MISHCLIVIVAANVLVIITAPMIIVATLLLYNVILLAFMCSHPVHKTMLSDPPPYTLIPCVTRFTLELGHQSRRLNDDSRNRNCKQSSSLSSKMNLSRSFSIGANTEVGPLAVLFAFALPCSTMALEVVDHSLYCFGIMLTALHAALIDSPASTRLLTFRTIASLSSSRNASFYCSEE